MISVESLCRVIAIAEMLYFTLVTTYKSQLNLATY
jgi:hypothetical protein